VTDKDYEELEALEEAARPVPWPNFGTRPWLEENDAALIGPARNALPALLAIRRAARTLIERPRCMGYASGCECLMCMANAEAEADLIEALRVSWR